MPVVTIDIADLKRLITEAVRDALRAEERPTLPAPPGSYAARVNAALEGHELKKQKRAKRATP